ncbi:hypothetical protein COCNU_04G012420 [Cocos nucifera]|uniref:PRC-barrel domain-containing protein n=1 Tax=Cocos nucifera TaxID=13894 RepID=A0A8K0I6T4_COCNU|nr:hypothetical protein COCNU_04G012420 [Cocos nucifera]
MCDCCYLAHFPHEFGTLAPRIRGSGLSGRIKGQILAHRWNSRDTDREINRKGRILSQDILRNDFKPTSSSIGLSRKASAGFLGTSKAYGAARIRSNSEGVRGNSGDNKPKKYDSFDEFVDRRSSSKDGSNPTTGSGDEQESSNIGDSVPSSFDFLELKRELEKEEKKSSMEDPEEDELIRSQGPGSDTLNHEEAEGLAGQMGVQGGKKLMRRSNLLAKQVISIQSACSLGFVSQLWVDTRSIGDVVLVKDESVMENELKMIGLDTLVCDQDILCSIVDIVIRLHVNGACTQQDIHGWWTVMIPPNDKFKREPLVDDHDPSSKEMFCMGDAHDCFDRKRVGYNVVTSGGRSVGKVRGYTFNVNSGAMESLELDPFGFSIIPSSLVSTYCLFVEDVLEVVSDTVVVLEHATSRVQRLTKGIWDTRSMDRSRDERGEYSDLGRRKAWSVHRQSSNKNFTSQKFPQKMRDVEDEWDLPMDY